MCFAYTGALNSLGNSLWDEKNPAGNIKWHIVPRIMISIIEIFMCCIKRHHLPGVLFFWKERCFSFKNLSVYLWMVLLIPQKKTYGFGKKPQSWRWKLALEYLCAVCDSDVLTWFAQMRQVVEFCNDLYFVPETTDHLAEGGTLLMMC